MKRSTILAALTALALAPVPADAQGAGSDARPNILFVFSDDHAPHAIGAYSRLGDGRYAGLDPTPK